MEGDKVLIMEGDSHPLHVVMFPWLGIGHIYPFIQLSNMLAHNGIKVTFLSPPTLVLIIRNKLHPSIPIVKYNLPSISGLQAGVESTIGALSVHPLLMEALDGTKPQIARLLSKLSPEVIVFDFVYHWIPPLAKALGIKSVYLSVYCALATADAMTMARLHPWKLALAFIERLPPTFLAAITGKKLYEVRDVRQCLTKHHISGMSTCTRIIASMTRSSAIAVKSATEIEDTDIKFIASRCQKPLLLCGALMSEAPVGKLEARWVEWLSKFPVGSIVVCSFGSEICLSSEQIAELITGLEMSGSPFLAILNFSTELKQSGVEAKVVGERMGGKGMVHSGWVQQQHILRHPSVGAYVGHGGLGSIMEAVVGGCQIVLIPQCGDQFQNTKLMTQRLKAGVTVKRRSKDGWFTKGAVCKAVRMVMKDETKKAKNVRFNNSKLRGFLLKESTQQEYIQRFIEKLKEVVTMTDSP